MSKEEEMSLSPWGQEILQTWEQQAPQIVESLRQSGQLLDLIRLIVSNSRELYDSAIEANSDPEQAKELIREQWKLPVEESEDALQVEE